MFYFLYYFFFFFFYNFFLRMKTKNGKIGNYNICIIIV